MGGILHSHSYTSHSICLTSSGVLRRSELSLTSDGTVVAMRYECFLNHSYIVSSLSCMLCSSYTDYLFTQYDWAVSVAYKNIQSCTCTSIDCEC